MASAQQKKFVEGVQPFLEDGEQVVATCIAQAKGYTRMVVSGLQLGKAEVGRSSSAAEAGEVKVANPMALALTDKRLLTLEIGMPIGLGIGGKVKDVLSAIPLADVDAIEVKRIALRQNVTITVRGVEIPLETNAKANAGGLAEEFNRLKLSAH
jgi:hypothetical protein